MSNYDVSIFIVTKDRQYINPVEYNRVADGKGVFVCITNDMLNSDYGEDNTICIHKDWMQLIIDTQRDFPKNINTKNTDCLISTFFSFYNSLIPNNERYRIEISRSFEVFVERYLDGYSGCQNIMENIRFISKNDVNEGSIPAIMMAYRTKINFDRQCYHGYLPAIGQLLYISKYRDDINSTLNLIDGFNIYFGSHKWWSSTEGVKTQAWAYFNNGVVREDKGRQCFILPLFKI